MAKIALDLDRALAARAITGAAGTLASRLLAEADDWSVEDVLCTSGPSDRTFEERHARIRVVIIGAGTFQYRSERSRETMTPGSLLLGNADQTFECGHAHGAGDRCLAFGFGPELFARLASDAGVRGRSARFPALRVPPIQALAPIVSRACAAWLDATPADPPAPIVWEELSVTLAAQAVRLSAGITPGTSSPLNAAALVTRAVRLIDDDPSAPLTLATLAAEARLSPYHFLRTFGRVTGVTPHQYVRRARLRDAATRLLTEPGRVIDIALDSGFGDVSNFTRAFRTEFGLSPQTYRATHRRR